MKRVATAALLLTVSTALSGCSLVGGEDEKADDGTIVLLTHGDFALPEEVLADFEEQSGRTLEVRPSKGVGELVNEITDAAGNPVGDVVFGVDNTFGSRVLQSGAVQAFDGTLPDGVDAFALDNDDDGALVPVDNGNVCVNVDDTWFAAKDLAPPTTLADLAEPAYRDLLVVPSAANSSTGLAFLLATIAEFGEDGWQDYWRDLLDNGTEVVADWSEAYYAEFTQGGEGGKRPIVVSYDSSPAFTVDGDTSTTSALLDTCFQQVEYAGVLDGTDDVEGATQLVEFLLSAEVQEALPESMYVFPVVPDTSIPADWARFAPRPAEPYAVDPADVEAHREEWLLDWTDLVAR